MFGIGLAQITIPANVISQLFMAFIGITASIAMLINFAAKRYGIGNESMKLALSAQAMVNTDYGVKSDENARMRYENRVLRSHVADGVKRESVLKEQIDILSRTVSVMKREVRALEKSESQNLQLIDEYKRQIADKEAEIIRLNSALGRCND